MARALRFEVVMPGIPEWMSAEDVQAWLAREISHPYDAAFEADVEVFYLGPEKPTG